MRSFSDLEKSIINRMIELDKDPNSLNVLANILSSFYGDSPIPSYCYISVDSADDVCIQVRMDEVYKRNKNNELLMEIRDKLSKALIAIVTLFEHLNESRLAIFTGDIECSTLGNYQKDMQYLPFDFLEEESKALVYKYTRKHIYLTEDLKILAGNNFKSEEEIRHNQVLQTTRTQLWHTQVALGLTFCGLVASILAPVFTTTDVKIKNEVLKGRLDNLRLNDIENVEAIVDKRLSDLERELQQIKKNIYDFSDAHNKANSADGKMRRR